MNLIFRLIYHIIRARRQPPIDVGESIVVPFRVLPSDLDINGHMNNGRYLTIMDVARLSLFTRIGLTGVSVRRRWRPVVLSSIMQYRAPLHRFERYDLRVEMAYWNGRFAWFRHAFLHEGEVVAVGLVKGLMVGPEGPVSMRTVFEGIDREWESPERPLDVSAMISAERAQRKV